jgi:formylglycine-generating enzyme required for sulfatase activity
MLAGDPSVLPFLKERLLTVTPAHFPHVRDLLDDYKDDLIDDYWELARDASEDSARRFQAACALASYDPENENWHDRDLNEFVAEYLINENPLWMAGWIDGLLPVRKHLVPPLGDVLRASPEDRPQSEIDLATRVLEKYAADDLDQLSELVLDARPEQFAALFDVFASHGEQANARLEAVWIDRSEREIPERRQTNAAVAALRMGQPERLWDMISSRDDPGFRSRLIHSLKPMRVDPVSLTNRLRTERDPGIRRALILAVGEYGTDATLGAEVDRQLERCFREDPDPGVHAAARWTLRQLGEHPLVLEIESEAALKSSLKESGWYVNRIGQTFAIVDGTEPFAVSSPASEAGREKHEPLQYQKHINRTYAIAAMEVTNAQLRAAFGDHSFWNDLKQNPGWKDRSLFFYADNANPYGSAELSDAAPAVGVNPAIAALYCNWLSRLEGIPEQQWCYELNESGEVLARTGFLELSGYRLPTDAEWERACRCGTKSARFFGDRSDGLDSYAWSVSNSPHGRKPVALLKPNQGGLFDIYGNVIEYCSHQSSGLPDDQPRYEVKYALSSVSELITPYRGGAHRDGPRWLRSAYQSSHHSYTAWETGFRPARTIAAQQFAVNPQQLDLAFPTQVPTEILNEYVGRYDGGGQGDFIISQESGTLYGDVVGGRKFQLLPMSEHRFFAKEVPWDVEFIRDENGKVVRLADWHLLLPNVVAVKID